MISVYDPAVAPNGATWLRASESERLDAVFEFCEEMESDLPNARAHATIHTVIETHIAMGSDTPVAGAHARMLEEGLSRHDAIHAVGSVLAEHMYRLATGEQSGHDDPNAAYYSSLEALTARAWLASSKASRCKAPRRTAKRRKKRRR